MNRLAGTLPIQTADRYGPPGAFPGINHTAMNPMKKIEQWMIEQIHTCLDRSYDNHSASKFNTSVHACGSGVRYTPGYERWIEVKLNGELIAAIYPFTSRIRIYDADGIINRSRINAILREFAPYLKVEKRKDGIVVVDSHRIWPLPDVQPLTGNWYTSYSVVA